MLTVAAITAVICLALFLALRELALRGWGHWILRFIFQNFLPPPGFYDRQFFNEIDLSTEGSSLELRYTHSHVGAYELGIRASQRLPMPLPRADLGATVTVRVEGSGIEHLEWTTGQRPTPWWTDEASGFGLTRYYVPRDVPLARPVTFALVVTRASPFYKRIYGRAVVYIGKASEK